MWQFISRGSPNQPADVFYPTLLAGITCASLCAGSLFVFRHRYLQFELRRMEALDIDR